MKIFAAGIATETNTFSRIPTTLEDFVIERPGESDVNGRHSLNLTTIWQQRAQQLGHDYVFGLMAWAPPGGATIERTYEALRDELIQRLEGALPVDIVLLMLHGSMVSTECDDCESDIIRRARDIVGPDTVIGVELDLHCNLSAEKIACADLVITYKEYPHTDSNDRAAELFDLAIASWRGEIKPTMALFDCRMVGLYPTSQQPMRGFVDSMKAAEGHKGILSVSLGHGFQFSDVPHAGAKMLVITDNDRQVASRWAKALGLEAHSIRHKIGFDSISLPMDQAFSRACNSTRYPVVVADQSDNPGGGAPGDSTFALRWILEHQVQGVGMAIFYDPEVVKTAKKAGVGATVSVRLGGKTGVASGDPVDLEALVGAILPNYVHGLPQRVGRPMQFPAGDVVALRCGSVDLLVGSERCQCFSPQIFQDAGINPRKKRLLVPKSAQHFYDSFAEIAAEVIYMSAPGAVAPDPRGISYQKLDTRNRYPWDDAVDIQSVSAQTIK